MLDPNIVAIVAGLIAWTFVVYAITAWFLWWLAGRATGDRPEEGDDAP